MTSVAIPAGITSIDPAFFQLFPNATSVSVAADNETYTTYNGMLFGKNDAEEPSSLLLVPEGLEGNAVLPSTLATVPACAFSRCTKLSAIVADFPGSTAAFTFTSQDGILYTHDMRTLIAAPAGIGASVAIADECTSVAEGAFWGNDVLATIVAPGSIASIVVNPRFKSDAVSNASVLSEALAADVNTDTALAPVPSFMANTTAQATIVTSNRGVWEQAGFKNFADPARPGDTAEADGFAYTLLDDFTLSVRWAGEGPAPEELAIPQTATIDDVRYAVSSIERDAFKGQESIRALTIPDGVRTIGASAFEDCASLEKATIAGSVVSIEASAFKGCTSLAEVSLGGGLRTLGASAFENTTLESIWLPASVEQIAERAFAANSSLQRIVALGDIAVVDATVLADCTSVEVYLPYRHDDAYAWRAGVPSAGNHVMPYGVTLSTDALILHQEESGNLFEGGYLESAGSIDVRYAYDAAPISVDPSTGTVAAKQTGKTTVTAQLRLNDKLLASASRAVIVALAPKPEEPAEDDGAEEGDEGATEDDDHDHDGEEGCTEGVDAPDVSYRDQLFEEGDYYTSGNFESEEKVINRSVALASMDAGISTMSLEVPSVDSYTKHTTTGSMGGTNKANSVSYDSTTKTLTWEMSATSWKTTTVCGGSVACTTEGHGWEFRKSRNKLNAVRKLVLKNWDYKNPSWIFSKMQNLEEVVIEGNFLSNGSGVTKVDALFADCPQLRVIPSNMTFPSTVTTGAGLFGFTTHEFNTSTDETSTTILNRNQRVGGKLLTAYSGSDAMVLKELRYSSNTPPPKNSAGIYRDLVTSYHTVTFDNQGGTGGHQTVGESTSSSNTNKTYTIKVPTGSPVPELIGIPTLYSSATSRSWAFGGYVDALNNAPKEYVGANGYPAVDCNSDGFAWIKITSNITLKALWYHRASFINGSNLANGNDCMFLLKGYSLAEPAGFSGSNLFTFEKNYYSVYLWNRIVISQTSLVGTYVSTARTSTDPLFRGYVPSNVNTTIYGGSASLYYDASGVPIASRIYSEPWDFKMQFGLPSVNIYSNVEVGWTLNYMRWQSWNGTKYGTSETGKSTANYAAAYTVPDVYAFTRWSGNLSFKNTSSSGTVSTTTDSQWAYNYRDLFPTTVPAYHTLKEVRKDSPTGEILNAATGNNLGENVLSGNINLYFIYEDNTPNDTIKWVANGGYLNGNTATTEKSVTVRRGNKTTAPTVARANTSNTRYTFLGWYNGTTLGCGAGGQVTANGNATYTAKWKTEYKITWNTGLSGAYWGNNTSDTAAKEFWVESGGAVAAPTAPKKTATSNTRWTWSKWNATVVTPATGPATYTGVWTTEYKTIWKLGSTEAYWDSNKSDKADKEKWIKHGDKPTQPATPKRDAVAQYTYTFNSWNGITTTVTGPAEYTAVWDSTVNKYETTWDVNSGYWGTNKADTAQKKTVQQPYGTVLTGPQVGTSVVAANKARYTFVGWSTNKNANPDDPSQYSKSISVVGANTYYAIFSANNYTINLMKNAGDEDDPYGPSVGSVTARYDHDWTIGAGNVPNRRGYYFIGWDTDPEYKGMTPKYPMAPDASGKFVDTTFSGNLIGESAPDSATLYAVWNESRYTIVFHENWGDDTTGTGSVPARIDALYSQQVIIPTNDLARTGYNFANWNTQADGSGATYKTRGAYTHVGLSDVGDANVRGCTVHLYAQWDANQYIVQFDPNIVISDPEDKGEWHIESGEEVKLVSYGTDVDIDTVFSRPGYEFIGWSFEKNVPADEDDTPIVDFTWDGDAQTFTPGSFRDLTSEKLKLVRLYAQWKGGSYTIEFDGNATDDRPVQVGPGGVMSALEMHYGVAKKLPANTFECSGFTFKGWNTKADGTGEAYLDQALVQDIPGVKDGKVTLFAQWSPVLSLTSPIDACIEVYIDGMDMYVYEVRAGQTGKWPTDTPNGDGTKDDHEDQFEHGQAALESRTPAKLFIEQIDCIPNLDPEAGMARIFPIDGTPALDSWEDFELEFTALNENTGKRVKVATEFGNSYAFVAGANNNYFIPAYDSATNTPGTLDYTLLLRIPESKAKQPNTVRYSEGPVKIATLMFTCRVAD